MAEAKRKIKRILAVIVLLVILLTIQFMIRRFLTTARLKTDRSSLHSLAIALESYYIDWSEYPDKLDRLVEVRDLMVRNGEVVETQPYLLQLPHSAFGQKAPPHYFRSPVGWFLWTSGPDHDFDITITPEFHETFDIYFSIERGMSQTPLPPWLRERLYDPTNGTYSNGDLLRTWQ